VDGNIFDNNAPNQTSLTKVFSSDPENGTQQFTRAWTTDLELDSSGNPFAIITLRANDVPVNTTGYNDHRFFYARYDGTQWNVHQLAKAGARLYSSEQDYTGLVALDPSDPNTLYMSSTIDPRNDAALANHEIVRGVTSDVGATWSWTPITFNSQMDNLRPTIAHWEGHTALLWMRGTYQSMFVYDLDIVGLTQFGPLKGRLAGDLNADASVDAADFQLLMASLHTSITGLTPDQAYAHGDLNGDFKVDYQDFRTFRSAYDNALGAGAFARAFQGVPEPACWLLAVAAAACHGHLARDKCRVPQASCP
jgi:hypothetical protein